jgi:hypothetical protein
MVRQGIFYAYLGKQETRRTDSQEGGVGGEEEMALSCFMSTPWRCNVQHVCVCGHKVGCEKFGKDTRHVHYIALAERCWETGEAWTVRGQEQRCCTEGPGRCLEMLVIVGRPPDFYISVGMTDDLSFTCLGSGRRGSLGF